MDNPANKPQTPATQAPSTSDVAKAAFEAAKTAFGLVSVTRNTVPLSFALQSELKGPTQGTQFLYPDTEISVQELVLLIGEETSRRVLNIRFKKGMKEVYEDNLKDNNGTFNADKFIVEAASYPFVSVSMAALKTDMQKLVNELFSHDLTTPEGAAKGNETMAKLNIVRKAIAAKERASATGAPDDADDEDNSNTAPAQTTS